VPAYTMVGGDFIVAGAAGATASLKALSTPLETTEMDSEPYPRSSCSAVRISSDTAMT
jgi:hypothetical protein